MHVIDASGSADRDGNIVSRSVKAEEGTAGGGEERFGRACGGGGGQSSTPTEDAKWVSTLHYPLLYYLLLTIYY